MEAPVTVGTRGTTDGVRGLAHPRMSAPPMQTEADRLGALACRPCASRGGHAGGAFACHGVALAQSGEAVPGSTPCP
jgi:hypothetical protein